MAKFSFCLLVLVAFTYGALADDYVRLCYYTNWSQYRPGDMKFFPEDIDATLCTHIIYAFANMEGNRLTTLEWNDEDMYRRIMALKVNHDHLKVSLAIGGWSFELAKMTAMLSTEANRQEFVTTSIDFLRQHNFDGLELGFQYPGSRGSPPEDKERFTYLVRELREGFDLEATQTGRPALTLSAAVGAGQGTIDLGYQIAEISRELDLINIMTYDFNGGWNAWAAHSSPLHKRTGETGGNENLNAEWAVNYWLDGGAIANKVVIGLPFYGQALELVSIDRHGYGDPIRGSAKPGEYTGGSGWSFYEVCLRISSGFQREYNYEHKVPNVFGNYLDAPSWAGYEDRESLEIKVDWMKAKGLAGVMIFALDLDDFNGRHCNLGPYPLLNAVYNRLIGGPTRPPVSTTPIPSTPSISHSPSTPSTSHSPTTTTTPGEKDCHAVCLEKGEDGLFAHPSDETRYCECWNGGSSSVERSCPDGTVFDEVLQRCDYAY